MTDINIIENWYEEKGEKIKNAEFSDEPIVVPHTEEEYVMSVSRSTFNFS